MSTPGDSNLDNIIKKNFMTEVQQIRVKKEIQALKELDQNNFKVSLQSSPIGLKIIVNLTKDFILKEIPETKFTFPILFEFLLEPKFPFVFPKLFCKTNFCKPSLSDGRDFVYDVIQRMWNPSIMLRDIVIFIPEFLKKLITLQIPEESQLMGKYYLGHLYNLEDFLSMDSVNVYVGTEMINEQSVNNERYLVIAESYFLNFQSIDKVRNTLRLIGWAHINSIGKIRKNAADEKMLVFLWRDSNRKGILIQNIFILEKAKQFLSTFMHMAQKYGNTIETIKKLRDLPLSEVTSRSYMNMDIEELLGNIEFLESKLEAELNIDVINLLMNLYQKAVEYFSALNDPTYSEFMEKLHTLLTREDIQIILKSAEIIEKADQPGPVLSENSHPVETSNKEDSSNVTASQNKVQDEEKKEKENDVQESENNQAPVKEQEELNTKEENKIQTNESNQEKESSPQEKEEENKPVHIEAENKEEIIQPQNVEEQKVNESQENQKDDEKENKEDTLEESENKEEKEDFNQIKENESQEIKEEEKTIEPELEAKENENNEDKDNGKEKNEGINDGTYDTKESGEEPKEEPKKEAEAHETIPNLSVPNNDDMFDIGDDDD